MSDLTVLYYSSNRMAEQTAANFRQELRKVVDGKYNVIAVTQKPIKERGWLNFCIGDIGQSYFNLYKQMYVGLQEINTPFVAMAEDNTLYNSEHFEYRPMTLEIVAYNKHMYFLDNDTFWTKGHVGTFGCIAPTKYLRDSLAARFERFPEEMLPRRYQKWFFMDPGFEDRLQLPKLETEKFHTKTPLITMAYFGGTYGKPKRRSGTSHALEELPDWGKAKELRDHLEGRTNPS